MFHLPQALVRASGHRHARGLAIVAILSLGVGVNVAVFAVVHAVLLRPLPHPDADRLVAIWSRDLTSGRERWRRSTSSTSSASRLRSIG